MSPDNMSHIIQIMQIRNIHISAPKRSIDHHVGIDSMSDACKVRKKHRAIVQRATSMRMIRSPPTTQALATSMPAPRYFSRRTHDSGT